MQERIGLFPYDPHYPVHSISDIGMDDANTTWLFQIMPGRVRLIGYFEIVGGGMDAQLDELERRQEEHGYVYGTHYMPHDIRVREWTRGGLTRIEVMLAEVKKRGLGKVEKVERAYVEDQINGTRRLLGSCEFDEASTADGVKCLRNYKKDWDEDLGKWKDHPRHDWASHGAQALAGLASFYRDLQPEPLPDRPRHLEVGPGNTLSLEDIYAAAPMQSNRI
jgi:hypothetical protein